MKIHALNDPALAAASLAATKAERSAASGSTAGTDATDPANAVDGATVTVSGAARTLNVASAGTGIDEAKVAAVKASIADGTFKVDSGAIADKMLSNAQEMLSRVRN